VEAAVQIANCFGNQTIVSEHHLRYLFNAGQGRAVLVNLFEHRHIATCIASIGKTSRIHSRILPRITLLLRHKLAAHIRNR
jgi:hypothetical protein